MPESNSFLLMESLQDVLEFVWFDLLESESDY